MYAPQPMLSELAEGFMVSKPVAGVLVSMTMIPLAIAPKLRDFSKTTQRAYYPEMGLTVFG